MRSFFSVLVGAPLVWILVINPMRADVLARLAKASPLEAKDKLAILERATAIDPCNTHILEYMGLTARDAGLVQYSLMAFGKAMECEPGVAAYRAKYGAMMFAAGWDGSFALREALILEPHNPIYRMALSGLTKPQ